MKKTLFYISLAVMAISCVKENVPVANESEVELFPMAFETTVEATKTTLAEDGKTVLWKQGDEVAVFDGTDEKKTFTADKAGASVTLSGKAAAADEYYATYPSYGSMTSAGVFSASVSATQNAVVGSMANKCAVLVSKAEDDIFNFKNVSALVKFNLAVEGVKSLTLMGNNDEPIAGKFTCEWNNGDPQITALTAPQVAVTLRKSNGSSLELGDYYFTIIPTNFEDGFSVVLGMNDEEGTQKIVTRSAALDLKKNQIFRTQNVPESAYKSCSNDFVKYHAGADLVYGGVTINEETYGTPTYVCENDTEISKDGVYFIAPNVKGVKMNYAQIGKLAIIGVDPQNRSSVHFNVEMQPKNGAENYFICANLNMTKTKNGNDSYINTTSGLTGAYGLILLNNCKIGDIGTAFARCLSRPFTLEKFIMQDCDYIVRGDTENSYVLYANGVALTFDNIVYENNVFHKKKTGTSLADFKLVHGCRIFTDKSTSKVDTTGCRINNIKVHKNTLSSTRTKTTGFIYALSMNGRADISNNFYVESKAAATITPIILSVGKKAGDNKTVPFTANYTSNITGNYFWENGSSKGLNVSSLPSDVGPRYSPGLLTFNPLSEDWDPENGVFGYKDNLQYYGTFNTTGTEKNVSSETNGAQRKVITDEAGLAYGENNMGDLN